MQKLDPSKIPGSVEITLEDGTKIWMRRSKVQDQLAVSHIEHTGQQEVHLIANLTMKTPEQITELWSSDYSLLRDQLKSFLFPAKKSSLD